LKNLKVEILFMKMKKIIALTAASFLVLAMLPGCLATSKGKTSSAATPQVISYLYSSAGDPVKKSIDDKIVSLTTKICKSENIIVEATDIGSTDMNTYLKMKAAAGDLQDVLSGDATQSGLGISGYIMPLPKVLAEMSTMPVQGEAKNGVMYNLPSDLMPWGIIYNEEYFTKAGIKSAPQTWAELMSDCAALKSAGINPFVFPLSGSDAYATGFLLAEMFGADVLENNPKWTSDRYNESVTFAGTAAWAGIYDKFRTLIADGYVDKNASSYTSASGQQAMVYGAGAMIGMPQAAIATFETSTKYHFGCFPCPGNTDANVVTVSADTGICLKSGMSTATLNAAIKFVKAYFSPAPYKLLLDYSISPSCIKGFTYTPKETNPYVKDMVDQMAAACAKSTTKEEQLFGSIGGYGWYNAWNDSYNFIAELFAGQKLTDSQILTQMDKDYESGKAAERAAESSSSGS